MAAGFMDGDTPPQALGLAVLLLSSLGPSLEALMQGAEPPVSTASPVTACASLAPASASALDHGTTSCDPVKPPRRTMRRPLSTTSLAVPRGKASTGPALSGT
jgi:hypothetical protein